MSASAALVRELADVRAELIAGVPFARLRTLARHLTELEQRARATGPEARARRAEIANLRELIARGETRETEALRDAVASGALRGAALLERLRTYTDHALDDAPHFGDEPLDDLLEALLETHGRFDGGPSPGVEMIHYDPSPGSATLALAQRGWFDDGEVFVDLGSGIGRVTLLATLLGRARCVGVEIDSALVDVASQAARSLGASRAEFRVGDARSVSLEDGTCFFFFAPFVGSVLDEVLGRLEDLAARRPIRVGSWGPTTERVAATGFLEPERVAPHGPFDLALFRSVR